MTTSLPASSSSSRISRAGMNAPDQVHGDLDLRVADDALDVVGEEARRQFDAVRRFFRSRTTACRRRTGRPARRAMRSGCSQQDARDPRPDGPQTDNGDRDGLFRHVHSPRQHRLANPAAVGGMGLQTSSRFRIRRRRTGMAASSDSDRLPEDCRNRTGL